MADLPFSDRLRLRREELEFSQEELAELANVSRGTVRNAEAGKAMSAGSLKALEAAVGWRPSFPLPLSPVPVQVLGAETLSRIGKALVDDEITPEALERRRNIADFMALILAIGEQPPHLPVAFEKVTRFIRRAGKPRDVALLFDDLLELGLTVKPIGSDVDPEHRAGHMGKAVGTLDAPEMPDPPTGEDVFAPYDSDSPIPTSAVDREVVRRRLQLLHDQVAWVRSFGHLWADVLSSPRERYDMEERILGSASPGEILTIARSGLSQEDQDGLAMYVRRRRARFDVQLLVELEQIIREMQRRDEEGGGD
ncbi:helix-turn-helix transcriptional regulator [Micromonospora sp. WMMD1102]|uniref:helix-turn-helix domain-containing protein n=1 Tax=Micromonospora sp. WMMD1102 TaxID=3016105 RepID=UPI002414D7EF|nr:helix-turn-helix transcriptional regulator [Micromonospora sp. WMMD1102]MDG4790389.1 helix-turn-helix transcriptional regulator [Micromonospora sp. WMMD1102]MDG4792143.1 helix-turn-helix transcriptional regulator [Micromonospora sp. WMMD1102]